MLCTRKPEESYAVEESCPLYHLEVWRWWWGKSDSNSDDDDNPNTDDDDDDNSDNDEDDEPFGTNTFPTSSSSPNSNKDPWLSQSIMHIFSNYTGLIFCPDKFGIQG
jgi:hypothetical protein